jgi:hypothetical protein
MRSLLPAAVFFVVGLHSAVAEVRIEASTGGVVSDYLKLFEALRDSGDRVVIDGPCFSACTLVLSTIPRDRICVTRRAVLGFHAPDFVDQYGDEYSAPASVTRRMDAAYPPPIRSWIGRHGGLTERPIYLRGRQLAALYAFCR